MSAPATGEPALLTILARSVAAVGAVSASTAVRRAASTVGGNLAVSILFAVSLCFLTFAGYSAMSVAMGSIQAALIVGCIYLFLTPVVALVLQARQR
jgi:hypothetical protein